MDHYAWIWHCIAHALFSTSKEKRSLTCSYAKTNCPNFWPYLKVKLYSVSKSFQVLLGNPICNTLGIFQDVNIKRERDTVTRKIFATMVTACIRGKTGIAGKVFRTQKEKNNTNSKKLLDYLPKTCSHILLKQNMCFHQGSLDRSE